MTKLQIKLRKTVVTLKQIEKESPCYDSYYKFLAAIKSNPSKEYVGTGTTPKKFGKPKYGMDDPIPLTVIAFLPNGGFYVNWIQNNVEVLDINTLVYGIRDERNEAINKKHSKLKDKKSKLEDKREEINDEISSIEDELNGLDTDEIRSIDLHALLLEEEEA